MRRVLFMLGFALLVAPTVSGQETIGPFYIGQAPASATGSLGGGVWGNVVNTPVTINEAFSGFSIIDDGWINISSGDFYEVTFVPPVFNGDGPDVVVFDAHYDFGDYTLRTSFDGFSASFVPGDWGDYGLDRAYYYGGSGPAQADIWGSPVDLSNVGVPPGGTVSVIRLTANNNSCDPLGVGVIGEPQQQEERAIPTLSPAGVLVLLAVITLTAVLLIRRRTL
jgi:hypothetical protein